MVSVPIGPEGTAQVTLDGSGNGTARTGPLSARETWHPATASVRASSAVSEATCLTYIGDSPTQANFIDGTFSGSSGDSTDRVAGVPNIKTGWYVWAVWAGGDPGATATLNVNGTKDL